MSFPFDASTYRTCSRRRVVFARGGMVCSSQPLAAQAGLDVLRRGGNAAGKVLMQVVAGSALAVLVDFETGYRGWGVSFVVPAFICAGIVAVVVLVMCNRTNWAGYVLYQAVLAVFGLAMPVLYFTGLAHSLVGAVVPSILAVATLAGMAVFGDRTIKNEFRRRLHF